MMAQSLHTHCVTPAQAAAHPEMAPDRRKVRTYLRLDPGLRRDDIELVARP
jgi:hypothetical protein